MATGQVLDGTFLGGRGFGAAMESLFSYLGSEYGNIFALGMFKMHGLTILLQHTFHLYASTMTVFTLSTF